MLMLMQKVMLMMLMLMLMLMLMMVMVMILILWLYQVFWQCLESVHGELKYSATWVYLLLQRDSGKTLENINATEFPVKHKRTGGEISACVFWKVQIRLMFELRTAHIQNLQMVVTIKTVTNFAHAAETQNSSRKFQASVLCIVRTKIFVWLIPILACMFSKKNSRIFIGVLICFYKSEIASPYWQAKSKPRSSILTFIARL